MQTTIDTKIKEGQLWRNKEKGYTIKVLSKLKKGVWKVSAHGKGSTTHKMTENSFHFYDLISKDDSQVTTKEEKMNINNSIRTVFNNKLKKNDMFSVDDIVDFLSEIKELKDFEGEKLKTSIRSFIYYGCTKTSIIKKHSNSRKVSSTKKVYQKLKNSVDLQKNNLISDLTINTTFFTHIFNNQIEIDKPFIITEFIKIVFDIIGGNKLNTERKDIIESRTNSFINKCVKKGFIKRTQNLPELIKLKNIEFNGSVIANTNGSQEIKSKVNTETKSETISEEIPTNTLNDLLKKFSQMPMGELVESFIMYFNILQEKEKTNKQIIEDLNNKIESIETINIDSLKKTLKIREDKIISLNKEVCDLKEKVKQLDVDVNHQLDENEKLMKINTELCTKLGEIETDPKPTGAWAKLKIGEVIS